MVPSFEVGSGREALRYADRRSLNWGLLLVYQPVTAERNNATVVDAYFSF